MLSSDKLRIVLAASEAVPFAKTGGLADVSTALSKALDSMGHDVTLILPDYRALRAARRDSLPDVTETGIRLSIPMSGSLLTGTVNWTTLPDTQVKVLLISQADYFDRPQLYMENGEGYHDNCARFCFFSKAVLDVCRQMVLRPDIIHCNDWQTGLVPGLLHTQYARFPGFENAASVMTLHNMAYQGRYWHHDFHLTGMAWKHFNMHQMEMWGDMNLLKTGIAFADQVTTVSPTYAKEICTPDGGEGLDQLLTFRGDDLSGILNGIDETIWNPAVDPHIAGNFSVDEVSPGKPACKVALQKRMSLPERDRVPLFGMVSRMSDQKGFDLFAECAERLLFHDVQFVFLGTGEPRYERLLKDLAKRHPGKVGTLIGFDDALAHQIEAGSDAFLMPSRFEPCGLNQMYSLKYGTVPIVRKVGGLADSVVNADPAALQAGRATGFVFEDYSAQALAETIERAISLYRQPDVWRKLMQTGMSQNFSWTTSACHYLTTYRTAIDRRHDRAEDGRM